MTLVAGVSDDVADWAARVGPLLAARPAEHHTLATIVALLRGEPEQAVGATLAWVADADGVAVAGGLRTPSHPFVVTGMPPAAAPLLAEALRAGGGTEPAQVVGPEPGARLVAEAWAEAAGTRAELSMAQVIHALTRVDDQPPPPPGAPGSATEEDRAVLLVWLDGFGRDVGLPVPAPEGWIDRALADGRALLWDDAGPASLVRWSPAELGIVRIVAVYTPPERRGRGYGQALVAEVSRRLLAVGAERLAIITDAADPTPNGVYRRVGFRPVAEAALWSVA